MAPAGTGQGGEIRIRKFDRLPKRRQTYALGLQHNESQTRVVVHDDFDWQLVLHSRQKLAHQHVEPTIATKGDDLARAVEHLDAIRLTKRSSDGAIVE